MAYFRCTNLPPPHLAFVTLMCFAMFYHLLMEKLSPPQKWMGSMLQKRPTFGKDCTGTFYRPQLVLCVHSTCIEKKMYKKDLVLSCNAQFIKLGRLMALWRKWIFFQLRLLPSISVLLYRLTGCHILIKNVYLYLPILKQYNKIASTQWKKM